MTDSPEMCSILGVGFGVCMAVGQQPAFSVISAIAFARRLSSLGSEGQMTITFLFGKTWWLITQNMCTRPSRAVTVPANSASSLVRNTTPNSDQSNIKYVSSQIYYNRPEVLHGLTYTEFLVRYNTSSKLPIFYQDNRALKDNFSMDRHFFVIHFEGMEEFRYAYRPVREVKRCIRIEMLYVTSGDIYYLRLILLNRKVRSDRDVPTYVPVRGGGKPSAV